MKKWLLRVLYAALVLLPVGAIADYTATQGAGSTVFAFVCSTTKICPATVLIDSSNVEKGTAVNPLRIDPTGTTTQPVSAAALPLPTGASTAALQGTNTATTAHTCATSGFSELGCLGQIDDDVKGPIAAGTNVIGKVGIDQTTPGTTNGVQVNAALPAGTNSIGSVNLAVNVTATDCSGTVTTGGTAVNAFTAQTTLHGFTILNDDTTEPLWISFTTTAAASTAGSYPLAPATATSFAGASSFTSPPGFGLNHALSVVAATTAHKFSCTWW